MSPPLVQVSSKPVRPARSFGFLKGPIYITTLQNEVNKIRKHIARYVYLYSQTERGKEA